MTVDGVVRNGTVVVENGLQIPEGTRVQIIIPETGAAPSLAGMLKYAGCMPDLPSDFAEQHDHYLHGTPKK